MLREHTHTQTFSVDIVFNKIIAGVPTPSHFHFDIMSYFTLFLLNDL